MNNNPIMKKVLVLRIFLAIKTMIASDWLYVLYSIACSDGFIYALPPENEISLT